MRHKHRVSVSAIIEHALTEHFENVTEADFFQRLAAKGIALRRGRA